MIQPESPERRRSEEDYRYALKLISTELEPNIVIVSVDDCTGGGQYNEFEYFQSTDNDYYDEPW